MRRLDLLLDQYGESHRNATNKLIHWICVPSIMFSLIGLLMAIPLPIGEKTMWANAGAIFLLLALLYYIRLSLVMAAGFVLIGLLLLWGNYSLYLSLGASDSGLALVSIAIFAIAWVGQFIGHKIEGKKPSFLKDLQFLLIGPAWLLHFIYRQAGISY